MFNSFLSILKIILKSAWVVKLPRTNVSHLYILANGPSLNESLNKHAEKFIKAHTLCVNNFAFSDWFMKIQPKYYVINAPEYYLPEPPTQIHKEYRENLFKALKNVNWEMIFFVPYAAQKSSYWKKIKNQLPSNIRIIYFNQTPVEGNIAISHFLFRHNLGIPRPHNVLIPSLMLAINMSYKKIMLYGADHSWHEDLKITTHNQIEVNHTHFYDKEKVIMPMYKLDGKPFFIHEILRKLYLAFQAYHTIKKYADSRQTTIINCSEKSYIDAFKKN
jgi:hypothetical protein